MNFVTKTGENQGNVFLQRRIRCQICIFFSVVVCALGQLGRSMADHRLHVLQADPRFQGFSDEGMPKRMEAIACPGHTGLLQKPPEADRQNPSAACIGLHFLREKIFQTL